MRGRRLFLTAALISFFLGGMVLFTVVFSAGAGNGNYSGFTQRTEMVSSSSSSAHRKLLLLPPETSATPAPTAKKPDRIAGEKCTRSDVVVNQAPTSPLPSGIPTYAVQITNQCPTGCSISRIRLSCGWFSSAQLINPNIFKRLRFNVCLVNNGKPLAYGTTLSFQYANTYPYTLSVYSVSCS